MKDEAIFLAERERDEFLNIRRKGDTQNERRESFDYSPPYTLGEILNQEDIEEEWVVDSIVLQNGITTVSGLPNHFKSLFVQMLVKAVASGLPFLGRFKAQKGAVLIIDREIPTIRLKKRWGAIGALKDHDIYFYRYSDPFKLDSIQDMKRLEELIDKHKFKLIIIDTFNRSHSGKETNSYSEIAGVFEPLKRFLEKTTIILIHHSNKSGYKSETPTPEELMGSTDFAAETDLLFTIRKKDKDKLLVHNLKAKDSPLIDPFSLRLIANDDGSLDLEYIGEFIAPTSPQEAREREILEMLRIGKKKKKEIIGDMEARGERSGTIENILTTLRNKGKINSEIIAREAFYFLVEAYRSEPDESLLTSQGLGIEKPGDVMDEAELTQKEEDLRQSLQNLDRNSEEYKYTYSKWHKLRTEGVNRGLWGFIPSPSKQLELSEKN